jgi:mannose-6-phosphate isomerase
MSVKPVLLGPNQPERFYRGGAVIARFRGTPQPSPFSPEDFIGSTTEVFSGGGVGLSLLEDGTTLHQAIAADPLGYLGPDHVARFGDDPALLVKLLDTGQRLLVHFHPGAAFALRHLDCRHGKTEAWVVIEVHPVESDPSSGHLYLGFQEDVDADVVRKWVDDQDTGAILGSLNRFAVEPGDTCLVPAGVPHAIGNGVTLVEVQEPTDLSILLEWTGFALDGTTDGHLGLGFDTALEALDRRRLDAARLAELRGSRPNAAGPHGLTRLLPPEADAYFRVEEMNVDGISDLEANFSILVVLSGEGTLHSGEATLPLSRGTTALVPYGAGPVTLEGRLVALRCRPPEASS